MTGNLFYFILSYEIRIFDCLFNLFIFYPGPCDHFLEPFRGSCCVKITKNRIKSTFLKLFDLIMTGNFVYFLISYQICIVDCFFNVFICHFGPCDLYLDPFRGCVMLKLPISTFLAHFDILSSRHCRETPASLSC